MVKKPRLSGKRDRPRYELTIKKLKLGLEHERREKNLRKDKLQHPFGKSNRKI